MSARKVSQQAAGFRHSRRAWARVLSIAVILAFALPSAAQRTYAVPKVAPARYDGDVRNLPQVPALPPHARRNEHDGPPSTKVNQTAIAVANVGSTPMPAPIQNFAGLSYADNVTGGRAGAGWPPDTNGDVGRNHYIEAVNEAFAIYDKTGVQLAAFTENSLWSGAGTTPCTGNSFGDPIVIYDRFADRWILANLGFANFSAPFYECIAVSQTSDPVAGGWWLYPLRMDPGGAGLPPVGTLNDYPKFGIWNDGCLYMSANGFGSGGSGGFVGSLFASLNLSDMEAGLPVTWSLGMIANNSDPFSMLPSNLLGGSAAAMPPAGTPNYFVSQSSGTFAFEVRTFTPGANCGPGGILSAPVTVSESSYTIPAGIPQPGTSNTLDGLDDRLLQKLQYRKVGSAESLWVVHSVRTSNSTPVTEQWAQLDVTGGTIATSPVQQQIYTPDATLNRWMGSIAADRRGNVALGYSTSNGSAPNYPSIAYSGRLATDPVNNLSQTETVLLSGSGSQTSIFRWGDYSSMSVDPTDDCTFWYTNEYYSSVSNGTSGNWQTRIGSFKFPSCAPTTPELNVGKTHTGIFSRGQNGATFTVTVSNTPNAPTTSGTVTITDTLPSGLSLVSMVGAGWTCNSNVCTRGDGLSGGASYPAITVTVNVASDASSPQVNSVTVSGGGAPSATATDTVLPAPRLFATKSHSGNFIQGQNGVYTVTVSNARSGSITSGTVTVTDTLPAGLTLVSIAGTGWACNSNSCTRSDALNGGSAYPPITVTVSVSTTATSPQVNSVSAAGGGSATATATDSTVIIPLPPPNDEATNATVVGSLPYSTSEDTTSATTNPADPPGCAGIGRTVWFRYVADFTGTLRVDTAGSNFDTVLVAYQGTVSAASFIGCNDDADGTLQSRLMLPVASGQTYYFEAGSLFGSTGGMLNLHVLRPSVLSITKAHSGAFSQGQTNATYKIVVSNDPSAAATSGTVTVTDTPQYGLTLVSMAGTGWTCTTSTCTRSDALAPGSSYPAITVTVSIANNAYYYVFNSANVSGGGSTPAYAYDNSYVVTNGWSISKTHSASFVQGQTGTTYTVLVSNFTSSPAGGSTVTVTDSLPSGLTLVSMAGTGWTCASNTCTRSDGLLPSSSYPPITVTVNVAANATSPQVNSVSVSGGGLSNNSATDSTVILASGLTIAKTHSGDFAQGQNGATYTVTVSNPAGAPASSGFVFVQEIMPSGLAFVSMAGTGWNCAFKSCSRSDALAGGSSYPAITVTVNVSPSAISPQVNAVTLSESGAANSMAFDSTNITSVAASNDEIATAAVISTLPASLAENTTLATSNPNDPPQSCSLTPSKPAPKSLQNGHTVWFKYVADFTGPLRVDTAGSDYDTVLTAYLTSVSSNTELACNDDVDGTLQSRIIFPVTSGQTYYLEAASFGTTSGGGLILHVLKPIVLSISKTHTGSFTQGQTGATYTLTVSNAAGAAATDGSTVSVSEGPPSGLTFVSMTGTGWNCSFLYCYRFDSLAGGTSYPPITVTVNVSSNATSPQVNSATVSGGGSLNASATDSTVVLLPVLSIGKTHSGSFTTGQTGAAYTVTVSNTGAGPTNGTPVTVAEMPPSFLTLVSMAGTGWTCTVNSSFGNCTRTDALAAGSSYSPIAVVVNVAANATSPQVNSVSVSGGGSVTASATDSTNITLSGSDLAQGKTASQSSTYGSGTGASNAVDGNTDGNFLHGSVTHTNQDANAWWQVDLGASAAASSISIWNRTDCCPDRLSDYWVFVSDTPFGPSDTPATLQNRAGTWSSHQIGYPNPSTSITVNAQGRYVRVQLSGTNYLSLAEVQVFGTFVPSNLAQGKTATQSSTYGGGGGGTGAANAVDGNTDGNFSHGSVTHTNLDANAWWQVDLGTSATVGSIAIWNRTDCCSDRLNDYWVFVSNTPFGPSDTSASLQNRAGTWNSHQIGYPNPSSTITVNAQGRYVRVQLSGTNYLSLAEVQVFGTFVSDLAQGKTATQSSTYGGGGGGTGAANAVDGNTDGNFSHGSVTHTNLDANAWWQVDLGTSAVIGSISIWNRTDCCSDRLNDYWVFVSDTPFGPSDTPATLQNRAGTWSSHQIGYPNPSSTITVNAQGRYLRVQLSGTNYLSLAEVQVYGP